jgi:hypothetical protein
MGLAYFSLAKYKEAVDAYTKVVFHYLLIFLLSCSTAIVFHAFFFCVLSLINFFFVVQALELEPTSASYKESLTQAQKKLQESSTTTTNPTSNTTTSIPSNSETSQNNSSQTRTPNANFDFSGMFRGKEKNKKEK